MTNFICPVMWPPVNVKDAGLGHPLNHCTSLDSLTPAVLADDRLTDKLWHPLMQSLRPLSTNVITSYNPHSPSYRAVKFQDCCILLSMLIHLLQIYCCCCCCYYCCYYFFFIVIIFFFSSSSPPAAAASPLRLYHEPSPCNSVQCQHYRTLSISAALLLK